MDWNEQKELEVKLAKARELAVETTKRYELVKSERETMAIQLQNIQQEFRHILQNRNESLQRWQTTIDHIDQCRQKLLLQHHVTLIRNPASSKSAWQKY